MNESNRREGPPVIFISYSHHDEAWKNRILDYLGVASRQGLFELWNDRRIAAGGDWERAINDAIDRGSVALFLVSEHFLTSDFILKNEVPRVLAGRDSGKLRVFPIIVEPCDWGAVGWLKQMNLRPPDGRPVGETREKKRSDYQTRLDLNEIAKEIRLLVAELQPPDLIVPSGETATQLFETAAPDRRPVELSLAQEGLSDPQARLLMTTCVVTDEPAELRAAIAEWKSSLGRDPRLPDAVKQRARKASLDRLLLDDALRPRLLDWISTTMFYGYLFYGDAGNLRGQPPGQLDQLLLVGPLVNRFRKKTEQIMTVVSAEKGVDAALSQALAFVEREQKRPAVAPKLITKDSDPLLGLARCVGLIASRYLGDPSSEESLTWFECIRNRVRLAMDVVTGEIHTRKLNPLP